MAMTESLVDYVLERGRVDYGQFAPRVGVDPSAPLYSHRKLLAYLFQQDESMTRLPEERLAKRISDLKIQQIAGQLNYFSEKIHAELSKKQLTLDGQLYRLQNEWLRKKMPDFYCYYFLKFAYANSYSRMHELFLSEIEHMAKERDSHTVLIKTIEARQSCLTNLRKALTSIKEVEIEKSLHSIREERDAKKRLRAVKDRSDYKSKQNEQERERSWQNQLQVLFQNITHLRKLTCYVVQLIRTWRVSVYAISDDPRRYRQRVIFFHNQANYLLKMLFDNFYIKDSILKKYISFSQGFDPFILRPVVVLEGIKNRTQDQQAFLQLIRPTELDMDKIAKALVVLAEQQYDQDQQSRFINQRSNFGELQQRKQFIDRRRDSVGKKNVPNVQSQKVLPEKPRSSTTDKRKIQFVSDKKSGNTQKELQQIKTQRQQTSKKSKVESSLNRLKQMRAADFKKVSPYLSRNQRIEKAQKVIQLQHKFRVAQESYTQSVVKDRQIGKSQTRLPEAMQTNKEGVSSRIFNKYIEQNIKMMQEANKKAFLYKNQREPQYRSSASLGYNRVAHSQRKQAQYERNLERYYPKKEAVSPMKKPAVGTKAVIQISNRGVRANQKIIQFELTTQKGKNVGQILENQQRARVRELTMNKLDPKRMQQQGLSKSRVSNLFQSQKQPQVLVIRQQPQKLQQIKQFLYKQIKQELIQQMKRDAENKQLQLNNMVQEQKRKKLQEIIQERKREQQRKREQAQRLRLAMLERQRKKLSFEVRVDSITYAQENATAYLETVFGIQNSTYNRLYTPHKIEQLRDRVLGEFYTMFLKGYYLDQQQVYTIVHYDWQHELHRRLVIDYMVTKQSHIYLSSLHCMIEYMWKNDPCEEIEMMVYKDGDNQEGDKIIDDLMTYCGQTGQIFEKQLYSNIVQYRLVWSRPSSMASLQFPYQGYYFGQLLNFKAQLLSASISFSQRSTPHIDMNLQVFTDYIFLIEELFRKYLTPQEVVQLRENSTNIRRLKDIFRIVLELEKGNPNIDQLTVVQGLNLDDLYTKIKQKKIAPYDRYYWHHFYDRANANRLLLSILQLKPKLKYPIQGCKLDDRRFLRINVRQKNLLLKSSIYPQQNIWILQTANPKIKIFLTGAEHYKLMRMQLFVFLNLVFNNIVEDSQRYINSIWIPQFVICGEPAGKKVSRITDFSISMKKSFFISEQIFWANNQYIKSGLDLLPAGSDLIFRESLIFGFLHTDIEQNSTGMPIYAKMIDRGEFFNDNK